MPEPDPITIAQESYQRLAEAISWAEIRLDEIGPADPDFARIARELSLLRSLHGQADYARLSVIARFKNLDAVVHESLAKANREAEQSAQQVAQTTAGLQAALDYLGKAAAIAGVLLSFLL